MAPWVSRGGERTSRGTSRGNHNSRGRGTGRGNRRGENQGDRCRNRERKEETEEQVEARVHYNSWKKDIKINPRSNDIDMISHVWEGALNILNDDDREWKQQLPRDLDSEEYFGKEHIEMIMSMQRHAGGASTFVKLAFPFLKVITHAAFLNCLSVDTAVGGIYNFISGSNGTRAIPFFEGLCGSISELRLRSSTIDPASNLEQILIGISVALRELLGREQRAPFNDSLPELLNSIENIMKASGIDSQCVTFQIVSNRLEDLRGIIAHAQGLVQQGYREPRVNGVSMKVTKSTSIIPTVDEIRSNQPDFLPSTDRDQPHFLQHDPALRHIDTQFQLLRHDIFGELKEALGGLLLAAERDPAIIQDSRLSLGNVSAQAYPNAEIRYVSFDPNRRNVEAKISFPQPPSLYHISDGQRLKWWEESKRLDEGVLVCLLTIGGSNSSLLFFTVTKKELDPKKRGLTGDKNFATTTVALATKSQGDLEMMLQLNGTGKRGVLIEISGVILATFLSILKCLQSMYKLNRLPFRQWILPDRIGLANASAIDVPPPMYARALGFTYSLKSILKKGTSDLILSPKDSPEDTLLLNRIEAATSLDRGQCQAFVAALTHEFVQIQGPPGTGKSFLGVKPMRVLLNAASEANLGPIIVVCFTNHALDQFLEHLMSPEVGVEKIIRIGGRSKLEQLDGKNLRVVAKTEGKTKSESYTCGKTYSAIAQQEQPIKNLLRGLRDTKKPPSWQTLKKHLSQKHKDIHKQFSRIDQEGYEVVGRELFDLWIETVCEVAPPKANSINRLLTRAKKDAYELSLTERGQLLNFWMSELREDILDDLYEAIKSVDKLRRELDKVHGEVDRRVLQDAEVIGVTTTGLAKHIETLQRVTSKVILLEEAGEIMEPHLLTALLPTVEHVISIGDHQQLRPTINNFNLSLESPQGSFIPVRS